MSAQKNSPGAEKLKGSVKEAIGKIIGNEKVETEGRAQQELPKSDATPKTKTKF